MKKQRIDEIQSYRFLDEMPTPLEFVPRSFALNRNPAPALELSGSERMTIPVLRIGGHAAP
jgi:hypothetical protein